MNKKTYAVFATTGMAVSLLLSGCQLLTGYQQIDESENAKAWSGNIKPIAGEVNIACVGTYHCEIAQIDQTLVIASDTHKPVNSTMLVTMPISGPSSGVAAHNNGGNKLNKGKPAQIHTDMSPLINRNSVKIVALSTSGIKGLTNYYARLKPAKREIQVNFYPENNVSYVERFAMIHDFMQPGTYQLHAYRKKSTQESGSLLESASPNALCVDLLQENTVKRRFCKQADAERQGEFVEMSMGNRTVTKAKIKV